jgi:FixJ family two-component response regulator
MRPAAAPNFASVFLRSQWDGEPMDNELIYLVDDDESVLTALSRLLTAEGFQVSSFLSASDFLRHHDAAAPGCAVLDVDLNDADGLEVQQALVRGDYARPTIFITGGGDVTTGVQAMKAGAVDFLTKPVDRDHLVAAVNKAFAMDRHIREEARKHACIGKLLSELTPREREVLANVVDGRLNKQIAATLQIAEKTVKVHRGRMMNKMKVRSVADLVRLMMDYAAQADPLAPNES